MPHQSVATPITDLRRNRLRTDFQKFCNRCSGNFSNVTVSQISLKYCLFDITPFKITDIQRNSKRFDKKLTKTGRNDLENLLFVLKFSESITEYRDQNGELVVTARSVGVVTEKVIEQ